MLELGFVHVVHPLQLLQSRHISEHASQLDMNVNKALLLLSHLNTVNKVVTLEAT